MNRKRKGLWTAAMLLICATLTLCSGVRAASNTELNQKADALYDSLVKYLREQSILPVEYKYLDITGDGIHEALILYTKTGDGSSQNLRVDTYRNSGVVGILMENLYSPNKFIYYRDSASLIVHGGGHGSEWYVYFQQDALYRYQRIAMKVRPSKAYGSETNGSWTYYRGLDTSTTISAKKFKKLIAPLKVGKKRTITKWKVLN